jgi:hypothetical protein
VIYNTAFQYIFKIYLLKRLKPRNDKNFSCYLLAGSGISPQLLLLQLLRWRLKGGVVTRRDFGQLLLLLLRLLLCGQVNDIDWPTMFGSRSICNLPPKFNSRGGFYIYKI